MAAVCQRLKLPLIIGMPVTGVVLGLFALNLFDPKTPGVSADLRQRAPVIILIKAGLSLRIEDLKKLAVRRY